MKKVISTFAIVALVAFGFASSSYAQEPEADAANVEQMDSADNAADNAAADAATEGTTETTEEANEPVELDFVQTLKQKFIEGDPFWMALPLICLIIGLAMSIERVVYLNLSTINTKKFVDQSQKHTIGPSKAILRRIFTTATSLVRIHDIIFLHEFPGIVKKLFC